MATNTDKIKEFFADFSDDGPQERELQVHGKTKPVWLRKLTAGEAMKINAGTVLKFERTGDPTNASKQTTTSETDLGVQAEKNALLVQFTFVWSDGAQMFDNIGQVRKLDGDVFDAMVKLAAEFNKGGDEDAGKGSKPTPSSAPS